MSRGICLVIEDDEDIAGLIGFLLTKEGFEVRSVRTALDALQQAAVLNPSLITLDLGLPDLDGLQIANSLRELSPAPILMITARADASDQFEGMAAGASAYLTKPFRATELRVAVTMLCPAPTLASRQSLPGTTESRRASAATAHEARLDPPPSAG